MPRSPLRAATTCAAQRQLGALPPGLAASGAGPDLLAMIPGRTTRIVLAAAHLDHDPTNNRLRNLKSLCQRCHIIHDAPYHRAQCWITHRRRYGAGDLFLGF
jgi:hypothetical protein